MNLVSKLPEICIRFWLYGVTKPNLSLMTAQNQYSCGAADVEMVHLRRNAV